MSNNFCLLDSQRFNENLQAVNLGKTLQNTILIDSNNNLLQNNTVNEQANNIQYINKKNQNIINLQINNNQDIQKCHLNNSLYAIYINGNEKIKYIKDENNNDIYDIDMNNETEFSFQEKLKEIKNSQKMVNNSIPHQNLNNITIPDQNLNNIMDNHCQSQTTNCKLTILGNNDSHIINNNPGNTLLNLKEDTEVYSKTDFGNPLNRPNLSINNQNSNKQNQKDILTEKSRKEENNKLQSELNNMPITESHIEQNVNSNNSNEEFFNNNNNNPILDIPTVKSNYN